MEENCTIHRAGLAKNCTVYRAALFSDKEGCAALATATTISCQGGRRGLGWLLWQ
ncbi:MAG: hypothetical protein MR971_01100 [Bacteroidales bacterium]|nr:hypothetical protein [Bacteroidales bacterium]